MPTVALARNAMNSRFEIVLHGGAAISLRAAAEEALDEISRLEAQLNAYSRTSELTQINARAAREPVRVEPQLFRLLQLAKRLHGETGGAFDLTIAPLMRVWGFVRNTGQLPDPAELAAARACVGMPLVELDEREFTVRFARPGVMLDPGAIGKGYALERAGRVLREAGVTSAILHGGTSSVLAIGRDENGKPWRVGLAKPEQELAAKGLWAGGVSRQPDVGENLLTTVELEDESLSVSAVWGKAFAADGKIFGHVLDPRSGEPAEGALLAAIVLPSATEADALSTALLTLGARGLEHIAGLRAGMRALVVSAADASGGFQAARGWR
ncbi:MAG: FAD:protein FMN transferase [Verrucomicrobia bacterium]|nr:FAD:protein FMN transferase [Verrucomicrobiota bacterium]